MNSFPYTFKFKWNFIWKIKINILIVVSYKVVQRGPKQSDRTVAVLTATTVRQCNDSSDEFMVYDHHSSLSSSNSAFCHCHTCDIGVAETVNAGKRGQAWVRGWTVGVLAWRATVREEGANARMCVHECERECWGERQPEILENLHARSRHSRARLTVWRVVGVVKCHFVTEPFKLTRVQVLLIMKS